MPTTIETQAVEGSTYVITAAFTDEDGSPVTPNAGLVWRLTDEDGTVINSREDVALTPATSVTIVLHGNDLALTGGTAWRIVTIEGTYDSSLGNNLELKDQVRFPLFNLPAVPHS